MNNPKVQDPNDFKVVEFFNRTDFNFTPELGAMYDGRPLFVGSGERRQYPYHIGKRLAVNLAKAVLIKGAPLHDPTSNNPVGTPLWSDEKLTALASSFITEQFMEEVPVAKSETDRLFLRVAELEKLFQQKEAEKSESAPKEPVMSVSDIVTAPDITATTVATQPTTQKVYQDKQEVMAELDKRGIKYDKRKGKDTLEALLA